MALLDFVKKKKESKESTKKPTRYISPQDLIKLSESCFFTLGSRKTNCDSWRNFYYQGSEEEIADINRVYGEINNMLSLIFSPEHIILEGVRLDQSVTEDDPEQVILDELTDVVDRNFYGNRLDVKMSAALLASLIDGNTIIRNHWSTATGSVKYIHYPPDRVGVIYEALELNDEAQIFCVKTDLTENQVRKYYPSWWPTIKAAEGREEGKVEQSGALKVMLGGPGSTDASIQVKKVFEMKARSAENVYEQDELFQFELDDDQWRKTVIINNNIIKDELTGLKNHNFHNIRPLIIPGTIWGLSAVYLLHKIQIARNKLIEDLNMVESLQVEPPIVVSGFMIGSETLEKYLGQLRTPGGHLIADGQAIKIEPWEPKLSIEDAFRLEDFYDFSQKFILGINEIMQGQAQKNVRSQGYASMLAQFASSELKRVAHNVEAQLEDIFTTTAQLYQINDDTVYKRTDGQNKREFMLAQYSHPYRIEIYAHTGSPITTENNINLSLKFAEAKMIPPEVLVKIVPMPYKNKILKYMKEMAAQAQKKEQEERQIELQKGGKGHGGNV